MFQKILCCVDGSQNALHAAEAACALAAAFQGKLIFLTVSKELKPTSQVRRFLEIEHLSGEPQYVLDQYTEAIMDKAKAIAERAGLRDARTEVRTGNPARSIIEFAEHNKIDAIVLGARGVGDIGGALLGSVSHKVGHMAPCTVITVRP